MRGDRIRKLREQHSLSQRELANRLDTHQTQVARWESNENQPSTETLKHLSEFFGVTSDYLLGLVEHPQEQISSSDLSPIEQRLIRLLRSGELKEAMSTLLSVNEKDSD